MPSLRLALLVGAAATLSHAGCAAHERQPPREAQRQPREQSHLLSAQWAMFDTGSNASLRGICGISDQVAWASGTGGTVLRTLDGGRRWEDVSVPGAEALDFRCIWAFNDYIAMVLSAGTPAKLYQTVNDGKTWELVFEDGRPEAFYNTMRFDLWNLGYAFGDPIDGRLQVIVNGGDSKWRDPVVPPPATLPGEVGFAASNSAMAVDGVSVFIGLGGDTPLGRARVVRLDPPEELWEFAETPILSSASAGIFSLAILDTNRIVAVGGDHLQPQQAVAHWAVSDDRGRTWRQPAGPGPRGYSSCVAAFPRLGKDVALAVGPYGLDISTDGGQSWAAADDTPWHALDTTPNGEAVWMSGSDGRIGVVRFE